MTDQLDQIPETAGPTDDDLRHLVTTLYTSARQYKRRYLTNWERYDRMLRNRTWSDMRDKSLPSPSSSEFFPTVATLVAWMTDQDPVIFASPHPDLRDMDHAPDPELVAKKAGDMQRVLQSWWLTQQQAVQLERSLWDLFTFGAGIMRTGYDPSADDGRGAATNVRCDPWAILPDPDATDLNDAKYLLEVRQVSMAELIARYPERANRVQPTDAQPFERRPRSGSGVEPVPQPGMTATGVTGLYPGTSTPGIPPLWPQDRGYGLRAEDYTGSALLIECWVKEVKEQSIPYIDGGRLTEITIQRPYWRYVAMASNTILTPTTENPFDHGQLPYIRMPMVESGEFWGIPLSEHILPAQIALNRILAALQVNFELTGNPIWLEPTNAGTSRTNLNPRPGARLAHNPGAVPQWSNPPQMNPQMFQIVDFWRNTIDRISGISAVARGANLRRREAAQAVDAVQEASFVRVRAVMRNMEAALDTITNQTAANVCQFYSEPRTIPDVGEGGSSDAYLTLGPNHFTYPVVQGGRVEQLPLRFQTWIEAGSSQPISRGARIAELDQLAEMGKISARTLLRAHRIPEVDKELAAIAQEQGQQMAAEAGVPMSPAAQRAPNE